MRIAGIMTGTSVDAIDVAICDITTEGDRHAITLIHYTQAPYPDNVLALVKGALAGTATVGELSALSFEMARAYADVVTHIVQETGLTVDAIGVHGQTIWHDPPASTWQTVSGPALSALTGSVVVHDFRAADVALGGQGAPLVPVFDRAFLTGDAFRVAVNIGGMANMTVLPPMCQPDDVVAFDTGPGNVLIDAVCRKSFGKHYDEGGRIAAAGVVIPHALAGLQQHPFFVHDPPKSTGREVFNDAMADELWRRYAHPSVPSEDLVATLTELTAWSIADHVRRYAPMATEVIVSGGGAHNETLLYRMAAHLPTASVVPCSLHGINVDAKEAMAFAYLAYLTLKEMPGNLPRVTGASRAIILGSISNCRGDLPNR